MSKQKPLIENVILKLRKWFESSLRLVLRHHLLSLSCFILFLVGGIIFSVYQLKFELFPIQQAYKVNFSGNTEINSSIEFTRKQVDRIEAIFEEFPEKNIIASTRTAIGGTGDNEFTIQVRLVSYFSRQSSVEEFKNFMVERVRQLDDLALENFDYFIDSGGPPSGRPVEINVFANDKEDRKRVLSRIQADLEELGYFSEINHDLKEGKEEYRVIPEENLSYSGITLKRIAEILRFAFEGVEVGSFEQDGGTVDWILKFDERSKNFDDPLQKIYILNQRGQRVLIENLVQIKKNNTINEIIHESGKRKNVLSANFDKNRIGATEVFSLLQEKYQNISQEEPKVRITLDGEAKESADTFTNFLFAIVGSIIIIYLLLVIQFNNIFQPFIVITSIPFGIVGIVFVFYIHGYSLSFLGMIGVLGFGGVVINASLIMVDYINEIKRGNIEEEPFKVEDFPTYDDYLRKIIVRGAALRFRPILITTLTTTIGLIPTSYGVLGRTDVIIAPMTLTMLWGLLVGTMAGLYMIPIIYLIEQQVRHFFFKRKPASSKLT